MQSKELLIKLQKYNMGHILKHVKLFTPRSSKLVSKRPATICERTVPKTRKYARYARKKNAVYYKTFLPTNAKLRYYNVV